MCNVTVFAWVGYALMFDVYSEVFVVRVVKKLVTVYNRHFLVTCETSVMKVLRINRYRCYILPC